MNETINRHHLCQFLQYLLDEDIARWYFVEKAPGGLGLEETVDEYIKHFKIDKQS